MSSERAIDMSCDVIQSLYECNSADSRASVKRLYEQQAQYSNGAISFWSRDGIADFFALLSIVQKYSIVCVQSSIWDIADTLNVHGDCTALIDHTVEISLFPTIFSGSLQQFTPSASPGLDNHAALFADLHAQSQSFQHTKSHADSSSAVRSIASSVHSTTRRRAPSTPHRTNNTVPHSPIRPAIPSDSRSLARIVLRNALAPRVFIRNCLTLNLRIITRLETNEVGKIVSHEDIIPLSTVINCVPFGSSLGWLARNVAGYSLRVTCATLDFMLGNRQLLVETSALQELSQVHAEQLIDLLPPEDDIPLVNDS